MRLLATDVYLFAGDSLTEGLYGESYVERVAKTLYLGRTGFEGQVVNAGRGGDTIDALLARIDEPLRQYRPRWVILAIGVNDVWLPWLSSHSLGWWVGDLHRRLTKGQKPTTDLDQFAAAYRSLIDKARTVAGARVLACTLPPIGEQLAAPINQQLARLNGVIKHVAADCQVPVADVWQAFVEELAAQSRLSNYVAGEWLFAWLDRRRLRAASTSPDEMSERRRLLLTFDGVHLNSRGADLWADTVVAALAQALGTTVSAPFPLAQHLDLACFDQAPLQTCCTPGWEARAGEVGRLLVDAYERLTELTGARPAVQLAVLNDVHWNQSGCPANYPAPCAAWDGEGGTVFAPEAYSEQFLRDTRLPEALAAWARLPFALAVLTAPAQATALADLLAVQELARLFLRELNVAPADPELHRLLAAYLTQAALRARSSDGASEMAAGWEVWTDVLARAGTAEGQVRHQAQVLYDRHGADLVASLVSGTTTFEVEVNASPPSAA